MFDHLAASLNIFKDGFPCLMFDQTILSNILLHEQMFDLLGVSVKREVGDEDGAWARDGAGAGQDPGEEGVGVSYFLSISFLFFFNIFILSLFSFVLYPNTDFSRVHIYCEGVNGVEAFVRRLIFWLFLRLTVKGGVSRKFAVISKPQNACLSAETKK